jgi:hypothetical protein
MTDDFDERMGNNPHAQFLSYKKHPAFVLQDRYVLVPHTLTRREKMHVSRHLRDCKFCKGIQARLRSDPNDWLAVWNSPDPRKI